VSGIEFVEQLRARAASLSRRVVFAEGDDERVREAALELSAGALARVTLIGGAECRAWARAAPGVRVRTPEADPSLDRVAELIRARRPERAGTPAEARALASRPLYFAAGLVALDEADATLGGASHTTADVLRAALWVVGPAPGIKTVSSSFYMLTRTHGVLTFADCGVQYPTAEQLCDIALAAAADRRRIVGDEPRVAFLSHSTLGSATGASIERARRALELFRAAAPDVPAEGELQADAALVPEVAGRKAPGSAVAGKANVLIFPDLDSGNISYKLVERLGGAGALGPIVQGLVRPCCDLSRGATAKDIVLVTLIAALQSRPT
jgi:phosphate acetyltransferase